MTAIALTFRDESGKKHTLITDKIRPGTPDSTISSFFNGMTLLDVTKHNGSKPLSKFDHFEAVTEPREPQKKEPKTTDKANEQDTPKPDPGEPTERVKPQRDALFYWHLSLKEIFNLKAESVVKRLKDYHRKGGDPTVFVTTLWLVKYVWHSDIFNIDQRIDPRDFYHELREIYDPAKPWTKEMVAALPEMSFIFDKDDWARLHPIWKAHRNEEKKALSAVKEPMSQEITVTTEENDSEETLITDPPLEEPPATKRPSKAKRTLLRNAQQKGKPQKKKKRGFFR